MTEKSILDTEAPKLPILLYDSECNLCNRFKLSLERLPNSDQISMISIHDKSIYEHFSELSFEETSKHVHVIDENKNIISGADAISYIIHKFPLANKFSWLIESNMGQKAIQFFHDKANQVREELQKHCGNCNK